MLSLSINRGTLYVASTFTDLKSDLDIVRRVWIEKCGDHDIKMSALDGHMMITFLLKNANLEGKEFEPFGLWITDNLKKSLKPAKRDVLSDISLLLDEEENLASLALSSEATSTANVSFNKDASLQISRIWERYKAYEAKEEKITMPRVSTLNPKQMRLFDLSAVFQNCAFPSFVKTEMASIVNFSGLPEDIDARGLIMHSVDSSEREDPERVSDI